MTKDCQKRKTEQHRGTGSIVGNFNVQKIESYTHLILNMRSEKLMKWGADVTPTVVFVGGSSLQAMKEG